VNIYCGFFRRGRESAKSDNERRHARLSVGMELGYHWTDFHDTFIVFFEILT
jgi:hypothetical protein